MSPGTTNADAHGNQVVQVPGNLSPKIEGVPATEMIIGENRIWHVKGLGSRVEWVTGRGNAPGPDADFVHNSPLSVRNEHFPMPRVGALNSTAARTALFFVQVQL